MSRPSILLVLLALVVAIALAAKPLASGTGHKNPHVVAEKIGLWMERLTNSSAANGYCKDRSGGRGVCVNSTVDDICAYGVLEGGLGCSGGKDIKCCVMDWGACATSGSCVTSQACSRMGGVPRDDVCIGPSDLQCCDTPGSLGAGNVQATVTWANDNCASSQGWECAEFTARSIAAGGFIPGLDPEAPTSTYGDWDGYNLRYVEQLHDYLVSIGWTEQGANPYAVQAGYPIFGCAYYCPSNGWEHACIGVGPNTIDCHNAEQCQASASGDFTGCSQCMINSVLAPPGGGTSNSGPAIAVSNSGPASNGNSASTGNSNGNSASTGNSNGNSASTGNSNGNSASTGSPSTGSTSNGSTSNGSTSNGSTSNGSTSNGSTSNGSTSNGSTSNGSTSNGSTSNGSTSNGSTSNSGSSTAQGSSGSGSSGAEKWR